MPTGPDKTRERAEKYINPLVHSFKSRFDQSEYSSSLGSIRRVLETCLWPKQVPLPTGSGPRAFWLENKELSRLRRCFAIGYAHLQVQPPDQSSPCLGSVIRDNMDAIVARRGRCGPVRLCLSGDQCHRHGSPVHLYPCGYWRRKRKRHRVVSTAFCVNRGPIWFVTGRKIAGTRFDATGALRVKRFQDTGRRRRVGGVGGVRGVRLHRSIDATAGSRTAATVIGGEGENTPQADRKPASLPSQGSTHQKGTSQSHLPAVN